MKNPEIESATLRPGARREAADQRIRLIGMLGATGIHLLLILLYALHGRDWSAISGRVSLDAPATTSLEGTRLVNIIEIEPTDPDVEVLDQEQMERPLEEPQEEDEEDEEDEDMRRVLLPGDVRGGADEAVQEITPLLIPAAAVFRIRITDPSLWIVARPDLLLLTPEQRMQLQLQGRLEAWNDSLNAVIAAEMALLDWTRSDGKGGKWGISPGKLHLGSITIPLPFGFGPNPWQAEQIARRRSREDDILSHIQVQVVRASWKERAQAIRRRKDRERERAEQRRSGSDTTSSRRGGR